MASCPVALRSLPRDELGFEVRRHPIVAQLHAVRHPDFSTPSRPSVVSYRIVVVTSVSPPCSTKVMVTSASPGYHASYFFVAAALRLVENMQTIAARQ
jgi:hypothetical protein